MKICDWTFAKAALRECARDVLGRRYTLRHPIDHLKAAMSWLVLAQEQTGIGGVSAGFGRLGWRPDYPETTGYIITTFLDYYHLTGDQSFLDRAMQMGDYELRVQTPDGAIPGGFNEPRSPTVFDTGQVVLGWIALYQETQKREYLTAARAASDWLIAVQDRDGSWPKYDHAPSARTYHTRVSWALVLVGQVSGDPCYCEAARRQLNWATRNQNASGWFAHAELRNQTFPVTHTIAYTISGLLESGIALQEQQYVASASQAADKLLELQRADGSLSGAFDSAWEPKATWRCVTGCAQMSISWLQLYHLTADERYRSAALRSNAFVCQTQNLTIDGPTCGAIKGSWPFYGNYERFSFPNWATKFFADALMLELKLT